jgi:hypothetical protein
MADRPLPSSVPDLIIERKRNGPGSWRTDTDSHLSDDTRVAPNMAPTHRAFTPGVDGMHSRKTEGSYVGETVPGHFRAKRNAVLAAVECGMIAPSDAPTWALRKLGMI